MKAAIKKNTLDKGDKSYANLFYQMLEDLSPRAQDVMIKRFGFDGNKRQTLEKIGQLYGITRERVRQIISSTLLDFKKSKKTDVLKPLEEISENLLREHGHAMEQGHFIEMFKQKVGDEKLHVNHLDFVMTLSDKFSDINEDASRCKGWKIKDFSDDRTYQVVKKFCEILESKKQPLAEDEALNVITEHEDIKQMPEDLVKNRKAVLAYLKLSKSVLKNPFGEWGLSSWSEVQPKSIKDKAYLVLKKTKKPLHFRNITEAINAKQFSSRTANVQTVHNELIKDKRFVLVGRGIYALTQWGYMPGTVIEVLENVLRDAKAPLTKDEIVTRVSKQRLVKKNTIVLALQNKEKFSRVSEGLYKLVE